MTRLSREAPQFEDTEEVENRPKERSDCIDGPRPCPWVGCRHHLYLDVNQENGSVKFNFPDLEPGELRPSCSLDVADGGAVTLDEVGLSMNLSRERIRQVEVKVLTKLRSLVERLIGNKPHQD
jgi:hypothetical protein